MFRTQAGRVESDPPGGKRGAGEVILYCKKCKRDKVHTYRGIYTAPVCIHCMKTLLPVPKGMRRCPTCLGVHTNKGSYCSVCKSARPKKPYDFDKIRDQGLRRNFDITADEYDVMLFQQGGVCAMCGQTETITSKTGKVKQLAVDHNHELHQIRGLLCQACNTLVGWIEKDRERVEKAVAYLKKHDS